MFISRESFSTHTLDEHPQGEVVKRVLFAALRAVDPATAVARFLEREGDLLFAGGRSYDLSRYRRVFIVGAGKAAAPMTKAAARILGDRLSGGLIICKEGFLRENALGELFRSGYRLPKHLTLCRMRAVCTPPGGCWPCSTGRGK